MPEGNSYPDGEENTLPCPGPGGRGSEVDQVIRDQDPGSSGSGPGSGVDEEGGPGSTAGCEGSGGKPSSGEQGQDDVEMNSSHDSSSDRVGGSRRHSSANRSTTGSRRPKSSKAGSSSCGLHGTLSDQGTYHTEGSSSDQAEHGRDQTHREMMETVQEMKKRLPSEKKSRSKASTMEALNYALKCVKQVQANSEYYKLMMSNSVEKRRDATVCVLEELESITSEHTLKNTDSFVVVFSLASGRVVYASEQACSILNCKRKYLDSAKFVELLYHQDVNVFYSHTAQPHLPSWNVGTDSAVILFECAQVKSFFCRVRGGKDHDGEMRYNPFRITPYLLKVQGKDGYDEQPCCLALAERIISGYEAPRIPMDKRIFTTTHSPGCVFLEVDDRAVPLLGYLPQDLIGTSMLTCLHPEDRTLMLAMHRKILKYAGQPPFEHSPIRFRSQNGDYITLDTSWSSFVNPWSRKVAFIIGRHKVRTGPLNEDVFAARSKADLPVMYEDIKELQAKIYKLFLQPVHNNGSSGYGSLGSNGSHEHYISVASSSDSNGNLREDSHRAPMTLQQLCADVNKVKSLGQQAYLDSRRKLTPIRKAITGTRAPPPHATQNLEVRGHLQQSLRDIKKQRIPSYQQINSMDSIIRYLESCSVPALKRKTETLSIATSSSSSMPEEDKTPEAALEDQTNADEVALEASRALDSQVSAAGSVAHTTAAVVGAPLTDITLSTKAMSVVSVTSQCSYSSTIVHVTQPESEVTLEDAPLRPAPSSAEAPEELPMVGSLTKEVLSAHTQKEKQEYVGRFRHRILQSPYSSYLQQDNSSMAHSQHRGDQVTRPVSTGGGRGRTGKPKHKRPKPHDSSDSYGSRPGNYRPPLRPLVPPNFSWPSSESQQPSNVGVVPPLVMPLQTPYFTMMGQVGAEQQAGVQTIQQMQTMPQIQAAPGMNPYMPPIMAVILPTYPANYATCPQGMGAAGPVPPLLPQSPFNVTGYVPLLMPRSPRQQVHTGTSPAPVSLLCPPKPPLWQGEDLGAAQHPPLFSSSRSSSPLQLDLLQEELPKPAEPQSSTGRPESPHEQHAKGVNAPSEAGNRDAQSTSSELLDMLLHEDARSGTGSNASGSGSGVSGGSLGSGSGLCSNGASTSHTGSSKYFASNDSSDMSRKARKSQKAQERQATFDKCVEDSLWTMIQHMPEPIMMTYQIRTREQSQVLKEDREKLLLLQPMQPRFSQEQKQELAEVHPWIQQHSVPREIDIQGCVSCNAPAMPATDPGAGPPHSPNPPTAGSSSTLDCPPVDSSPASDT